MENLHLGSKVTWKAPSNIAIVKYWGKKGLQFPQNTSLSFTLSESFTETTLTYKQKNSNQSKVTVSLDGKPKPDFVPKIESFISKITPYIPEIQNFDYHIDTHNSFPHSSGIASSASSFAALALCFMSLYKTIYPDVSEEAFYRQAAVFARLGSGSATRSVMGSHVVWGSHPKISDSNDEYGIAVDHKVHEVFKTYHDTILLVDKGQKKVSSSLGHSLMEGHPFAERRFMQAQDNMAQLMPILKNGDVERFIQIMESEALSLHAMMMTANPYFILMHPNTLAIIHKIWDFRAETKIPVGFTLDAGANVHVLYPHAHHEKVNSFIINDLAPLCENNQYICDRVGNGASRVVD